MRVCPCLSHGKKGQGRESASQRASKVQDCGNWGDPGVLKALVAATQPLLPNEKEGESCGDQEQHGAESSDFRKARVTTGLKGPSCFKLRQAGI